MKIVKMDKKIFEKAFELCTQELNSDYIFETLKQNDDIEKQIAILQIEKIETTFTACKSFIKTEDYGDAICEVEKTVFLVNHLTDKYSFNLDNIF